MANLDYIKLNRIFETYRVPFYLCALDTLYNILPAETSSACIDLSREMDNKSINGLVSIKNNNKKV
jgi:hypothetical protein